MYCCGVYFDAFSSCRFVFTDFTGNQGGHFITDFIISVDRVGDLIKEHRELVCREDTEVATLHTKSYTLRLDPHCDVYGAGLAITKGKVLDGPFYTTGVDWYRRTIIAGEDVVPSLLRSILQGHSAAAGIHFYVIV